MKRTMIWVLTTLLVLVAAGRTFAQDTQTVSLNDTTPGVDLSVSMSPDTAGAVSLQLSGAAVTVKDSTGKPIFNMNDNRVHALELHFAPSAAPYTITVERLPGVQEGYLTVNSQADITYPTGTTLVTSPSLTTGQEFDTPLSAASPAASLAVSIPANTLGNLTANFPGSLTQAQVVDATGTSVATLDASSIDGLSLTLDGGNYQMALVNKDAASQTVAGISVTTPAQVASLPAAVMTPADTAQTVTTTTTQPTCTVQIAQSSINLRSGPGTGYSITGYAYRTDSMTVAGTNAEQNWLLVGKDGGTGAWMSKQLGTLNGDCSQLQVYDIPYRAAQPPQIIIQNSPAPDAPSVAQAAPNISVVPGSGNGGGNSENEGGDD